MNFPIARIVSYSSIRRCSDPLSSEVLGAYRTTTGKYPLAAQQLHCSLSFTGQLQRKALFSTTESTYFLFWLSLLLHSSGYNLSLSKERTIYGLLATKLACSALNFFNTRQACRKMVLALANSAEETSILEIELPQDPSRLSLLEL